MDKIYNAFTKMPETLLDLAAKTRANLKDYAKSGIPVPAPGQVVRLEYFIVKNPKKMFPLNVVFGTYGVDWKQLIRMVHKDDDRSEEGQTILCPQEPDEYACMFKADQPILILKWSVEDGEKNRVDLDISGAQLYCHIFSITPARYNTFRRYLKCHFGNTQYFEHPSNGTFRAFKLLDEEHLTFDDENNPLFFLNNSKELFGALAGFIAVDKVAANNQKHELYWYMQRQYEYFLDTPATLFFEDLKRQYARFMETSAVELYNNPNISDSSKEGILKLCGIVPVLLRGTVLFSGVE